jgi:hypothetical protein
MQPRLFPAFVIAAVFAVFLLSAARAAEDLTTIKFSDPAKPGTLKIALARGTLRIKGADVSEVTVKTESKPASPKAVRKDGLRVLTAASSFALSEKDNVITLDAVGEGIHGGGADFTLTTPRNTTVVVNNSWGGDIFCANLSGDIEVHGVNGAIRLDDVSGGVLVETMNGEIHASLRELRDNKPVNLQSTNGEVVVRLPADAKANERLRTQNGAVLTDFEETALVTKTESTPRPVSPRRTRAAKTPTATPATPAAPAAAPKAPAAPKPEGLDESEKEQIRAAVRESVRAGTEAAREAMLIAHEAVQAAHAGMAEAGIAMKMPLLAMPTISGGKLVTGTLNGGGPEIVVATMNGDVTLRKLEKK